MSKTAELAINGGPRARQKPMPSRLLMGDDELRAVERVFADCRERRIDVGFQDKFERHYTEQFCRFQGGGFADAVSSGTAAVYLALAALDLEPGSEVIVSPVTDPGSVAPVILLGHRPVLADAAPGSLNTGPAQFVKALSAKTKAAVLTHCGGLPMRIGPIAEEARSRGIRLIEDCSQSPGALYDGSRVGTFGDVATFSTMFSKSFATGGCGGMTFTRDEDLYWKIRSRADRGKPFRDPDFDPKDPAAFLFPALNFNLDEISCAIGSSTLARLEETIAKRLRVIEQIDEGLVNSTVVSPLGRDPLGRPSPFFHTLTVDTGRITCSKQEFASAVAAEGINVNPHYRFLVCEWGWARKHLGGEPDTPEARACRDRSFNVLLNERYTRNDVADIIRSIRKVERALCRG